jgi:hypothetical protein
MITARPGWRLSWASKSPPLPGGSGLASGRPGRYTLYVRATDTEGNVQALEQPWNYQGMGNNMVHRVEVIVE